ncbi:tol-pal system-associated acyl-CoA thioesterase [Orrella sp. JC864]|uniref:tol-pal system-associated acyl-CoA thioesterase n=1 Tax=Orrella sp. JC864 TaxID=3120298 RepID=UPI001429A49A
MTTPATSTAALTLRVYYEDTDAGGVVFYANYLKFLERARTEWLRALGVNQSELAVREHRLFVVQSLDMQYLRPARLDDLLVIHSRITRLGRASIHFAQRAERNGELLAAGNIQVCCVDAGSLKPAPLPRPLWDTLKAITLE